MSNQQNPGVSAVLSFFVPGLGQIFNGQLLIGFVLFFSCAITIAICLACINTLPVLSVFFGVVTLFIWVGAVYQAYDYASTPVEIEEDDEYEEDEGENYEDEATNDVNASSETYTTTVSDK